jgi:PHP family Zn ribbon phosphoesterase
VVTRACYPETARAKRDDRATVRDVLACRVLGHRYRFSADGPTMRWACARSCGSAGSKQYASAEEAQRYARELDIEDRDRPGRRPPLVSLLPLVVIRRLRRRRRT